MQYTAVLLLVPRREGVHILTFLSDFMDFSGLNVLTENGYIINCHCVQINVVTCLERTR